METENIYYIESDYLDTLPHPKFIVRLTSDNCSRCRKRKEKDKKWSSACLSLNICSLTHLKGLPRSQKSNLMISQSSHSRGKKEFMKYLKI